MVPADQTKRLSALAGNAKPAGGFLPWRFFDLFGVRNNGAQNASISYRTLAGCMHRICAADLAKLRFPPARAAPPDR
jgi:hypothetical protein